MPEGDAQTILERLKTLKGMRSNFDDLWDQVKRLVLPDGGEFIQKTTPGEKRTRDIYEMTAALANEKFKAALEAFLTPRTSRWHTLKASDDDLNKVPRVKQFFEESADVLFKLRNAPNARFYGQVNEFYGSLGPYGNACLFVDEVERGGIRYRNTHIGQAWIETNFMDVVDTVYFEYELTAKAAVQKWEDKAPDTARTALEASPFHKHKYLHVVRPNAEFDPERVDAAGMRFEAFDVGCDDQVVIDTGGYQEFPYIWSRYTVNPAEMYGRGPGMLVLPDIQTLQEMEKVFLRSGHKVADPPLLVANDGVLGRGRKKIRIAPGGINMGGVDSQGRQLIQPLQTGARLDITHEMQERKREVIEEAFLGKFFDVLARDRVQMTATEVLERAKEKGQLLTPLVGRQQAEFLGPLIEREMGIAQRQGRLPEMPGELLEAEGEYEIEYESVATQMQRSDDVAAFQRLIEIAQPFIEVNPQVLAVIKEEEALRHFADVLGVPSKILNTEQEMRQVHDAQAQALQEQQLREDVPVAASAVRDIAQAQATQAA